MSKRPQRTVITLTTDFGLSDAYVGVLKGVILGINRDAVVVDLCHLVPAHSVATGAFLLGSSWRQFPPDSIHLIVIDPGVGSARMAVALQTPFGSFVGPDNGVLSMVIRDQCPTLPLSGGSHPTNQFGSTVQAVWLNNPAYWLPSPSSTFHGRDIFAPVAAHLSLGLPIERLGPPAESMFLLPATLPEKRADGTWIAHVIHIDHFGNLITDLSSEAVASLSQPLVCRVHGATFRGPYRYYAEGPELLAIVGSSDRLELAAREDSAAGLVAARLGDPVEIAFEPKSVRDCGFGPGEG